MNIFDGNNDDILRRDKWRDSAKLLKSNKIENRLEKCDVVLGEKQENPSQPLHPLSGKRKEIMITPEVFLKDVSVEESTQGELFQFLC